jgi:hypothetical protein
MVQRITVNATATDLDGYFYIVNSGEISMPIGVYSSAEEMEYFLESMVTITDVDVSVQDLTLNTDERTENYGRDWLVTFKESHAQSLFVTSGFDVGTVACGGSVWGSQALVYVEKIQSEELPAFADIVNLSASRYRRDRNTFIPYLYYT